MAKLIVLGGGVLMLLAIIPTSVEMDYDGKLTLAVLGITFMIFAILCQIATDLWR